MKKTITRLVLLCALISTGNLFAQLTPEVLYYKFDGTGTSVPNLASAPPVGTATATINGGLSQGGSSICRGTMIGSGISSTTDYVNTGWAPNLGAGSWTISFRSENITPSSTLFYIFGDANTSLFRCFTNGVAGANNWILRGAGLADVYINGGATVAPHMNTFVYDAGSNNVKAYLDGVLVSTVAQTAPNLTGTGPFKVVGYSSNVGMPLNGHLDEFRVYSHALSAADVAQLYNPFSTAFLGADFAMCPGNPTTLSVNWPASTVAWSTTETTDNITVTAAGTYSVTVSGTCGSGTDEVVLSSLATSNTIAAATCGSFTSPAGNTYTSSGIYYDTLVNAAACDSIITINLTIYQSSSSTLNVSDCNTSYTAPSGATYTSSGTYTDIIPNVVGCDSVITINLTLNAPTSSSITASACDTYTAPSGAQYTSSGTYTDIIPNVAGCDSTITINLTVNNSSSSTLNVSACDMYTAPSGAQYTSSGTYTDMIANAAGCDSTITINLTINTASSSTISASACDTYTAPSGATYNTSGTYTDMIPNAAGCDSIITINLTVNYTSTNTMPASSCGPYTSPAGNIYTSSGTYTDVIPNAAGCDSIIVIVLNVTNVNVGTSQNGATLSATASGATYQWIDCSTNTPIANATSQNYTATVNGSYAVIVTQNSCSDTSACLTVTGIGISENDFANLIKLYPNPTQGNFNIDLGKTYSDVLVTITDVTGRVVYSSNSANTNLIPVNLNEPSGFYLITVEAGNNKAVIRLVKE